MATAGEPDTDAQAPPAAAAPPSQPLPLDNANAGWTSEDEAMMLKHLIKMKSKAGDGHNFQTKHFQGIIAELNNTRTKGGLKAAKTAHQKFGTLKKMFEIIQDIKSKSGWTWSDKYSANIGHDVTANSGTWTAYTTATKGAARFKNAGSSQPTTVPDGPEIRRRTSSPAWDIERAGFEFETQNGPSLTNDEDGSTGSNDTNPDPENQDSDNDTKSTSPTPSTPAVLKKRHAATADPTPYRKKPRMSGADALASMAATASDMVDVLGGFHVLFAVEAAPASAPISTTPAPATVSSMGEGSSLQETPHRRQNAIIRVQELETWLCDSDLVILIDILQADISKADTYNALVCPGLRVAWVQAQLQEANGDSSFDSGLNF
ncbi:hypothetical protein C8J57DRAFT_1530486 [Mycena rebaudengoi]|nr:hypothetical protein C8J57DRAFT_1530486 [Mycena rebaudengoi]